MDKSVKLWDYSGNEPVCIATRNMSVGSLYVCAFDVSADTPFLLATGGNKGKLALWDITENKYVQSKYSEYIKPTRHSSIQHADESTSAAQSNTAAARRKANKQANKQSNSTDSEQSDSDMNNSDNDSDHQ